MSIVTAIVLIRCERVRIPDLAQKIANTDGVSEVFSVAGRFDLVAVVKVSQNEDLADVVGYALRQHEGILETETLIAFREYSQKEMAIGYDLGLD